MPLDRRALVTSALLLPALAIRPARAELHAGLGGLARLVGTWRGEGDGEPGHSVVERSYEEALGGAFIVGRHRSSYAPQPKNPKGEEHHHLDYLGFDKLRRRAVLRQFHSEGFVAQYVAASDALDGAEIIFDSEAIENIPAGFKARETWRFTGADTFEEIFELAPAGRPLAPYSHNRFHRA